MKNKIIFHQFDPVIYPRKLWIVITEDEQIILDRFDTLCDIEDFAKNSNAIVTNVIEKETKLKGCLLVFCTRKDLNIKTITHESVHVTSNIFNDCNMTMGFDGGKDEHFAYLCGWVALCCEEVIKYKRNDN